MDMERKQLFGISDRADTAPLARAIRQAKGLDELLPLVDMLSRETEALMNGRKLSENAIQRIVVTLTLIRSLLATLEINGCGSYKPSREDVLVKDLVDRYRDIEGRIKEMRNDLARAKEPFVP